MRYIPHCVALCILVLNLHCAPGDDAAGDTKKLQGSWELTELIIGGQKVPANNVEGGQFIFRDNRLTVESPRDNAMRIASRSFTFKLDPSTTPARVKLTAQDGEFKGAVSSGIYELDGDVLRWCQSDDPKATGPPKEFRSLEGSKTYLFTFKKGKP